MITQLTKLTANEEKAIFANSGYMSQKKKKESLNLEPDI